MVKLPQGMGNSRILRGSMKNLKCMLMFELVIIILTVPLWAGAPPPEELMNAKKIYLVSQTSDSKQFDALHDALAAWGRWEVVTNKEEADLIFTFFVEMKASSQTVQSCFSCPPSMVLVSTGFSTQTCAKITLVSTRFLSAGSPSQSIPESIF